MKTSSNLMFAICLCVVPQAFADLAPDNELPEDLCTVALVQGADESCRECVTSFRGPDCADTFTDTPLAFRCRTFESEEGRWTEVWCAREGVPLIAPVVPGEEGPGAAAPTNGSAPAPAATPPQAADTAPASRRGCSASPVAGETGFGVGALIAALALIRRRRD